jgi:hypothetical protein
VLSAFVGGVVLGSFDSSVVVAHKSRSGNLLRHVKVEFFQPNRVPCGPP